MLMSDKINRGYYFMMNLQLISKSNDYFTPASSKFSPFHNGKFVFKGQLPTVTVREFNPFIIPAHQSCHVILRR